MKKKVLFKAPALTYSGYGVHARQVADFLMDLADDGKIDLYIELTRWGNTPWALRDDQLGGRVARIKKYFRSTVDSGGKRLRFDVSVQLLLPNEWTIEQGAFNVGMTAGVESTCANPMWVDACNKMDMVIVPSTHAERALRAAGEIRRPLHVVPEAYIGALDEPLPSLQPTFGIDTDFNFLIVGQLTANHAALDRKNIYNTINVMCDAFKGDSDVGVVLKVNSGRSTKLDRKVTCDRLKTVIEATRKGDFPKFHIVHGNMTDDEMACLYRHPKMKAFVSLTRGEGFGLPILEAAVAGLPVITTNWSGHLDFMSKGRFIPVDYTLKHIPPQKIDKNKDNPASNIWMEGAHWACPIDRGAVKALKKFRQSPDIPTQWATDLACRLREEYSLGAVHEHYMSLLKRQLGV